MDILTNKSEAFEHIMVILGILIIVTSPIILHTLHIEGIKNSFLLCAVGLGMMMLGLSGIWQWKSAYQEKDNIDYNIYYHLDS